MAILLFLPFALEHHSFFLNFSIHFFSFLFVNFLKNKRTLIFKLIKLKQFGFFLQTSPLLLILFLFQSSLFSVCLSNKVTHRSFPLYISFQEFFVFPSFAYFCKPLLEAHWNWTQSSWVHQHYFWIICHIIFEQKKIAHFPSSILVLVLELSCVP